MHPHLVQYHASPFWGGMQIPLSDRACMALSHMVAGECGLRVLQRPPEDTLQLSQHQCFVLPRDVAHQRQPGGGVILVVAEILDPVAIGIKEIHAGCHPVVGVVVQSDALGLKLFVGLFQVRQVLDQHRKVVEAKLPRGDRQGAGGSLEQGDVMVNLPTGQKGTRFPPAGDLEPENLGVELRGRRQVLDIKYYVTHSLGFCHDASSLLQCQNDARIVRQWWDNGLVHRGKTLYACVAKHPRGNRLSSRSRYATECMAGCRWSSGAPGSVASKGGEQERVQGPLLTSPWPGDGLMQHVLRWAVLAQDRRQAHQ